MEIITKEMVHLSLRGEDKEQVIYSLAESIHHVGRIIDFELYYKNVLEREELTSTGIGFGIAIPHGKTTAVKECAVAFARLTKKIEWGSLDNRPVDTVFLLAVPEKSAGDEHLKMLAALSRKLIHKEFREFLATTENKDEIVASINESLQHIF